MFQWLFKMTIDGVKELSFVIMLVLLASHFLWGRSKEPLGKGHKVCRSLLILKTSKGAEGPLTCAPFKLCVHTLKRKMSAALLFLKLPHWAGLVGPRTEARCCFFLKAVSTVLSAFAFVDLPTYRTVWASAGKEMLTQSEPWNTTELISTLCFRKMKLS